MDPILGVLAVASVVGKILEVNGQRQIDPQWLEDNFGSAAFAQEFNKQLMQLQSSPYGQELFSSAYAQGQQLANTIRANAARSGFGGAEGVQSGASIFATSAGEGAAFNLRRQALAGLAQQADARAQATLNRKYEALAPGQQKPSKWGQFGSLVSGAAGAGMIARQAQLDKQNALNAFKNLSAVTPAQQTQVQTNRHPMEVENTKPKDWSKVS